MSSKITNIDPQRFQTLADSILELDFEILGVYLIQDPTGSVIAESVRPEFKKPLVGLSQTANGMAPQWDIVAFKLMQRLDPVRSKLRYLDIVRDEFKGLIFQMPSSEDQFVVLTLGKKGDATEIYKTVRAFVENSFQTPIND